MHFLKWKLLYFDSNFTNFFLSMVQITIIYNGLVPNRWQAIIWTNDGLVCRCKCVTWPQWVNYLCRAVLLWYVINFLYRCNYSVAVRKKMPLTWRIFSPASLFTLADLYQLFAEPTIVFSRHIISWNICRHSDMALRFCWSCINERVSEMWVPLAASRKPAGGPEQAAKCAICFWT